MQTSLEFFFFVLLSFFFAGFWGQAFLALDLGFWPLAELVEGRRGRILRKTLRFSESESALGLGFLGTSMAKISSIGKVGTSGAVEEGWTEVCWHFVEVVVGLAFRCGFRRTVTVYGHAGLFASIFFGWDSRSSALSLPAFYSLLKLAENRNFKSGIERLSLIYHFTPEELKIAEEIYSFHGIVVWR